MKSKAQRRFDQDKKKKKTINMFHNIWHDQQLEQSPKYIGRFTNTHQPCSCEQCGNPRRALKGTRKDKLTIQELKIETSTKNQLKDLE